MIVVMKQGASREQIDGVIERIEQLGLRSHVIEGTELTVVAALGEKRDGAKQSLETVEGVEKVVPILAPYKMASTEVKKDPTVVEARNLRVGGGSLGVVAGPCSVESREQILERVWGYHTEIDSHVLEVYIGHLRQKLEAHGGARLIQTIRGYGYALRE